MMISIYGFGNGLNSVFTSGSTSGTFDELGVNVKRFGSISKILFSCYRVGFGRVVEVSTFILL